MASIGPQLPPELTKRKRTPPSRDDDAPPPSKQARHADPPSNNDEIGLSDPDSDSDSMTGPLAPPRTLHETSAQNTPYTTTTPSHPPPPSAPSSDSEDDYGPLPASSAPRRQTTIGPSLPSAEPPPQHDTWMLAPPPPPASYTERDPTRLRARKFASRPGAQAAPPTGPSSIWTETPQEKLQRQRDALLGRTPSAAGPSSAPETTQQRERDRRIAESLDAARPSKSLYREHGERRKARAGPAPDAEDDPSKRAFDREKDMAVGVKIGSRARSELISKSANFGGRFQKGSFL